MVSPVSPGNLCGITTVTLNWIVRRRRMAARNYERNRSGTLCDIRLDSSERWLRWPLDILSLRRRWHGPNSWLAILRQNSRLVNGFKAGQYRDSIPTMFTLSSFGPPGADPASPP